MPKLENERHEAFAQLYVLSLTEKGEKLTAKQAYIKAGYAGGGADQAASKLLRHPKVAARVLELSNGVAAKVHKHLTEVENAQATADQLTQLVELSVEKRAEATALTQAIRIKEKEQRHLQVKQVFAERAAEAMELKTCIGQTEMRDGKLVIVVPCADGKAPNGSKCRICEGTGKVFKSPIANVAGARTGTIVLRDVKVINGKPIVFTSIDTVGLQYLDSIENQIAVERGEVGQYGRAASARAAEESGPITVEKIEEAFRQLSDAELDRFLERGAQLASGSIIDVMPEPQVA